MSKFCKDCGGEIIFRYVDGVCTPIHLSGCCYESSPRIDAKNIYRTWSEPHGDFCRPSKCPRCKEPIFFIKYNGGSVYVDELGWPWPKHPCFDYSNNKNGFDAAIKELKNHERNALGLVVKTYADTDGFTVLVVRFSDGEYYRYFIEGGSVNISGALVAHDLVMDSIYIADPVYKYFKIIRYARCTSQTTVDEPWVDDKVFAGKSEKEGGVKCPYCRREFNYRKLFNHLCQSHGHLESTSSLLHVKCRICDVRLYEKDLLRHVITDHVVKLL